MRSLGEILTLTVAVSVLCFGSAAAEPVATCREQPDLLAYADYLLDAPENAGQFWRDREAAGAAYLKIVHAGASYDDARKLIDALAARERPPERIDELDIAHLETEARRAKVLSVARVDGSLSGLQNVGDSALRALLLKDADWFIAELARAETAGALPEAGTHWLRLAKSVADRGDDELDQLARKAEAAELWELAFQLDGQKSRLDDLVSLVERAPVSFFGVKGATAEAKANRITAASAAALWRYPPSLDLSIQPAQVRAYLEQYPYQGMLTNMARLDLLAPQSKIMLSIVNYTGNLSLAQVAVDLIDRIDRGNLDPVKDPDNFDLALVRTIDGAIGKEMRKEQFGLIDGTQIHFDRAIARASLSPRLSDPADRSLPDRPPELSEEFDWDQWRRVAGALRSKEPVGATDGLVAAHLLAGAGRHAEALAEIDHAQEAKDARPLAYEQMLRLDDLCGNAFRPTAPQQDNIFRF